MKLPFIVRISRPRFWLYLLGPFLIGAVAADPSKGAWPWLLAIGLYFTFPANFLVYGVNDLFDYETDKLNPKKKGYEDLVSPEQQTLVGIIVFITLLIAAILMIFLSQPARLAVIGFIFFGIFYSSPPIRAKTKPLLDSFFNILYIFPGIIGYAQITGDFPPLQVLVAATLWCMAMHAYSAVPDIISDQKAEVDTVATWLGSKNTIIFCLVCYVLAAFFSFSYIGYFSVIGGLIYTVMMMISLARVEKKGIFEIYKWFPTINMVVGAGLFFWILL